MKYRCQISSWDLAFFNDGDHMNIPYYCLDFNNRNPCRSYDRFKSRNNASPPTLLKYDQ